MILEQVKIIERLKMNNKHKQNDRLLNYLFSEISEERASNISGGALYQPEENQGPKPIIPFPIPSPNPVGMIIFAARLLGQYT